jgi:predicted metal-binding membrane protein
MSGKELAGVTGLAGHPLGTMGLWPQVRSGKLFVGLTGALVALAWLGLVLWEHSPYGRFVSHKGVHHGTTPFSGDDYRLLIFFVAAWTLMTVAMMLPTSLPLIAFFQALVRQRSDQARLVALLVTGYLGVWVAFAFVAHLGDQGIHAAAERVGWLEENAWVIGASTFLFAGLYQFSSLKYRCLDKCRSPAAFVLGHWRGRNEGGEAFRLGVHHGLFCLGCCWSLMLLMFAVGVGNIGWMLALAAVMATEKNVSWGRRLSAPVGVILVVWAAALTIASVAGGGTQFGKPSAIVGPGPVASVVEHGPYRVDVRIRPNRAAVPNHFSVRVTRAGTPVGRVEITATFTMLDMKMQSRVYDLHESAPGLYRVSTPPLVMAGQWGLSLGIRPPARRSFDVLLLDHM